jgi:hypothetical protein
MCRTCLLLHAAPLHWFGFDQLLHVHVQKLSAVAIIPLHWLALL